MFNQNSEKMKKTIFAAFAALCMAAGTSAFAQPQRMERGPEAGERPSVEQMAREMTDRMAERLKLTEKQSEHVYAATLEQLQTMEAHREAMRKARAEQAEKMKSILSTEQFMEWSKMQGPHPGARRGPQMMRKAPEGAPACREGACCDRPCPREKMKGKK